MGEGNIRSHGRQRARYRCTVCSKTFSARAGTIFFRRRTNADTITRVVTLVSHGCPIPAIEAAYGIQDQTVRGWMDAAGVHCEAVHHAQVVHPRDLQQVQADEIRVTTQAGVLWVALAMMVSTRLWLGGAVSATRDRELIGRLVALVAACAAWGPLLFVTDGLPTYLDVVRRAFRTRQAGMGGDAWAPPAGRLAGPGDRSGRQAVRRAGGDRHDPPPGAGERPPVLDLVVEHARLPGLEHRVHRTLERDVPRAAGGLWASHAHPRPPPGHGAAGPVSAGDSLQLLYGAYESPHGGWASADTGDGGRHYGSCLDPTGTALASRRAPALATAPPPRAARTRAPSPD